MELKLVWKKILACETKVVQVESKAIEVNDTKEKVEVKEVKGNIVKSPMVGTFYLKPSPTSDPYVEIGKNVKNGWNTLYNRSYEVNEWNRVWIWRKSSRNTRKRWWTCRIWYRIICYRIERFWDVK